MRFSFMSVSLLLILGSCVYALPQSSGKKPKAAPPSVTLTEVDNGKDIDLTAGTLLIVKLPSNPTTGYTWTLAGEPAPLKLLKTSFRGSTTKATVAGAPGTDVFQLSASATGMASVTLVYRRSWEYNIPPVKTFSVRVNVR